MRMKGDEGGRERMRWMRRGERWRMVNDVGGGEW